MKKKSTGVSVEVVRNLNFVLFDASNSHTPVIVEYNEETGEPEVTETLEKSDPVVINMMVMQSNDAGIGEAASSSSAAAAGACNKHQYHSSEELCPICLLEFEQEELLQEVSKLRNRWISCSCAIVGYHPNAEPRGNDIGK